MESLQSLHERLFRAINAGVTDPNKQGFWNGFAFGFTYPVNGFFYDMSEAQSKNLIRSAEAKARRTWAYVAGIFGFLLVACGVAGGGPATAMVPTEGVEPTKPPTSAPVDTEVAAALTQTPMPATVEITASAVPFSTVEVTSTSAPTDVIAASETAIPNYWEPGNVPNLGGEISRTVKSLAWNINDPEVSQLALQEGYRIYADFEDQNIGIQVSYKGQFGPSYLIMPEPSRLGTGAVTTSTDEYSTYLQQDGSLLVLVKAFPEPGKGTTVLGEFLRKNGTVGVAYLLSDGTIHEEVGHVLNVPADTEIEVDRDEYTISVGDRKISFNKPIALEQEVGPLYPECGEIVSRLDYPGDPKGLDGKFLPTGLANNWESKNDVFNLARGTACVLGVDTEVDPNFGADAIRLKIGFYDVNGELHEYPLMLGGVDNNGNPLRPDVCEIQPNGDNSCTSYLLPDALQAIQDHFAKNSTRQIQLQFVTVDNAPWKISDEVNGMKPTIDQLVEALETGRNFPIPPDGFYLVGWQTRLLNDLAPQD